ncbi:MAG: GntR family transcriptional regulator, partial [Paenibacillus sp.]|nr:GntR family transcriptional regulator [Paenibacillus sp.]
MRRESEFRYSKLANILREQIMSGYIKPGEFLYSENELCRFYQISRTSVRKSLEQLQKEGLIVKKVGQGTIVSPDLVIPESPTKVLRIMAPSPSHYVDLCMPI